MCWNFHLGYVGKTDEYVSDKLKEPPTRFRQLHPLSQLQFVKQKHDRTRLSAAIFRKTSSLRGILGKVFHWSLLC